MSATICRGYILDFQLAPKIYLFANLKKYHFIKIKYNFLDTLSLYKKF